VLAEEAEEAATIIPVRIIAAEEAGLQVRFYSTPVMLERFLPLVAIQ
jgi:hypothetical protein